YRPAYCNELLFFSSVCDEWLPGGLAYIVVLIVAVVACAGYLLGLGVAGAVFYGRSIFICFGCGGICALSPRGYIMVVAPGPGFFHSGVHCMAHAALAR